MTELYRGTLSAAILLVTATAGVLTFRCAGADASQFDAAWYHPVEAGNVITLFPMVSGAPVDVALPARIAGVVNLISFGPDGRSAYLQVPSAWAMNLPDELVKVEFGPTRQNPVPGSGGLGDISSLTVSLESGRLFVSASGTRDQPCGAWEIDPGAGTHRPLRVGSGPSCGGGKGKISPDGKRIVTAEGQRLSLISLETGTIQPLGTGRAEWSPDGNWIAIASRGQIVVVAATDLSLRKRLGPSGVDGHLVWSPDSKRLLFAEHDRRCSFLGDSESLATVDMEGGKRKTIPSSHCMVSSSAVGWIDVDAGR